MSAPPSSLPLVVSPPSPTVPTVRLCIFRVDTPPALSLIFSPTSVVFSIRSGQTFPLDDDHADWVHSQDNFSQSQALEAVENTILGNRNM